MTLPAQDPIGTDGADAADTAAAIARIAEQVAGLRRSLRAGEDALRERIAALDRLTQAQIQAQADKVALALAAADKATIKADTANERRFESVNEFRAQLTDQAGTFMTRTEAVAMVERNAERIQELTDRLNRTEGRDTGSKDSKTGMYAAIGAIGVVITIVVVIANAVFR
jgi:hypothetical protein